MRKNERFIFFKYLILACVLAVLPFAITGCGKTALNTPVGISVDDDLKLSWQAVKSAVRYEVEISLADGGESRVENTGRKTYVSLKKLEEGDYVIRIKAKANEKDKKNKDSEWSDRIEFQKGYETGCIYKLIHNDSEYELIKAGTSSGKFEIADSFRGKPVVSIGENAFNGSGRIEEVTVTGNRIETIGNGAFYNCSALKSISLPDSVTYIGAKAFQSCRLLTDIKLPAKINKISEYTFAYCVGLEEINLPSELENIEASAFTDCWQLKQIVIPDSVKTIGEYAFAACTLAGDNEADVKGLSSVTFGRSLKSIGNYAFSRCSALKTVEFKSDYSVKSIGEGVFSKCTGLASVNLPVGLESIGDGAFSECKILSEAVIPSSVEKIGYSAFAGTELYVSQVNDKQAFVYAGSWLVGVTEEAKELTNVTSNSSSQGNPKLRLRSDITGIADGAFLSASNGETYKFTQLNLPGGLKYIGAYAFRNCKKLDTLSVSGTTSELISIGDYAFVNSGIRVVNFKQGSKSKLKRIGNYAFYGCSKLGNNENLIPETVTSVGRLAFKGTSLWENADDTGVIYAGKWVVGYKKTSGQISLNNALGIADYAFEKCPDIVYVTASAITLVGRGAFYKCENLQGVSFSPDLSEIKDYAFYGCTKLTSISFSRGLTSIGRSAFYNCSSLAKIDLSRTEVAELGDYAFYGCTDVTELKLGKYLKSIPKCAFYGCKNIKSVTIPATVGSIGLRAFQGCSSIVTLDFAENSSLTVIDERAFGGCESIEKITFPDSLRVINKSAFNGCAGLKEINLASVNTVGDYAFYGAANLEKLDIPVSVKNIGKFAFKGASLVKSVFLPSSVDKIGAHAFYGLKETTFYTDAAAYRDGWDKYWNSSYRPVVTGCVTSEDGAFVVSVTTGENTVINPNAQGEITAPERTGFVFEGWSDKSFGDTPVYAVKDIATVPAGTKLYAVWKKTEP